MNSGLNMPGSNAGRVSKGRSSCVAMSEWSCRNLDATLACSENVILFGPGDISNGRRNEKRHQAKHEYK